MLPCHASLLDESTQHLDTSKVNHCKQYAVPYTHASNGMFSHRYLINQLRRE